MAGACKLFSDAHTAICALLDHSEAEEVGTASRDPSHDTYFLYINVKTRKVLPVPQRFFVCRQTDYF